MKKRISQSFINFSVFFLIMTLFISLYSFHLQRDYSHTLIEAEVERDTQSSLSMHKTLSKYFLPSDFTQVIDEDYISSPRYLQLQSMLNGVRKLNSTRYIYTAKKD